MQSRKYDLLIFSQTVQETQARNLIAQASAVASRIPGSWRFVQEKIGELGSPTYQVDLNNPGGLRSAVARILEYETTPSAC